MRKKKLSIIVPVYNEKPTVVELLELVKKVNLGKDMEKEIIVVDDMSTDGTRDVLKDLHDRAYKIIFSDKNEGKGGAIKRGLKHVTGDYVIFQDADLEYDPKEYKGLLDVLLDKKVDFVLGQRMFPRFFSTEQQIRLYAIGNRLIAFCGNMLYGTRLRDYEPCYKLFKIEVLRSIDVKSNGFEYDIELMARLFKNKYKFAATPITYNPRSFEEGKKITWHDGLKALWTLLKMRFS